MSIYVNLQLLRCFLLQVKAEYPSAHMLSLLELRKGHKTPPSGMSSEVGLGCKCAEQNHII